MEAVGLATFITEGLPPYKILRVNQLWLDQCGFSLVDTIGATPKILQGPATDHGAVEALMHGIRNSRDTAVSMINHRKGGHPFRCQVDVRHENLEGRLVLVARMSIFADPYPVYGLTPAGSEAQVQSALQLTAKADLQDLFHDDKSPEAFLALMTLLGSGGGPVVPSAYVPDMKCSEEGVTGARGGLAVVDAIDTIPPRRVRQALPPERDILNAVLEATGQGIGVIDAQNGLIVRANSAMTALIGSAVGNHISTFVSPSHLRAVSVLLTKLLQSPDCERMSIKHAVMSPSGQELPLESVFKRITPDSTHAVWVLNPSSPAKKPRPVTTTTVAENGKRFKWTALNGL